MKASVYLQHLFDCFFQLDICFCWRFSRLWDAIWWDADLINRLGMLLSLFCLGVIVNITYIAGSLCAIFCRHSAVSANFCTLNNWFLLFLLRTKLFKPLLAIVSCKYLFSSQGLAASRLLLSHHWTHSVATVDLLLVILWALNFNIAGFYSWLFHYYDFILSFSYVSKLSHGPCFYFYLLSISGICQSRYAWLMYSKYVKLNFLEKRLMLFCQFQKNLMPNTSLHFNLVKMKNHSASYGHSQTCSLKTSLVSL